MDKLEDINPDIINKMKSLTWWYNLKNTRLKNGTLDKGFYSDKYFGNGVKKYQYLTVGEIQMMYEQEHKNE